MISVVLCPTRGIPGMAHSSAARAGMEAAHQHAVVEWGKYGIGLVCVAPGLDRHRGVRGYGEDLARASRRVPMSGSGTAEEVARHDRLPGVAGRAYITGQTIVIDGGLENTAASWPGITADPLVT